MTRIRIKKDGETPKEKRTATRNSPPTTEHVEQRFKVERVNENTIGREHAEVANRARQHDTDFSPPRQAPEDAEKWTPDNRLLESVKTYFEALSIANNKVVKHEVLPCSEPIRKEYRNIFKIAKTANEQNAKWTDRLNAAKLANTLLKEQSAAMNGVVAKLGASGGNGIYCLDDEAQQNAIELASIRFEELNMENSWDSEFGVLQESDDESDTSSVSSNGVAKYKDLADKSHLANQSLKEMALLMKDHKKNEKGAEKLHKRSKQLDIQLAVADRKEKRTREDLGKYSRVVDEVCASDAWKKKHDLL